MANQAGLTHRNPPQNTARPALHTRSCDWRPKRGIMKLVRQEGTHVHCEIKKVFLFSVLWCNFSDISSSTHTHSLSQLTQIAHPTHCFHCARRMWAAFLGISLGDAKWSSCARDAPLYKPCPRYLNVSLVHLLCCVSLLCECPKFPVRAAVLMWNIQNTFDNNIIMLF